MEVEKIIKAQQPEINKRLKQQNRKQKKSRRGKQEHLSFSDFENMMKHDSYYRGKGGAIKQR